MSLVYQEDNYTIFDRESTKNGSPISKTFTLKYDQIVSGVLKVSILADTPVTLPQLPSLLGGSYVLSKITVNGHVFAPNDPQNTSIYIHSLYASDPNLKGTLINGTNTISIDFIAPFGAGVVSPNAQINASLQVVGQYTPINSILPKLGLSGNGLPTISDLGSQLQNWVNNNTPTFIAILVLVAIIIGALAYLFGGRFRT